MHPFLDEGFHVRWSTLTPEAVEPDIRKALEIAKANLDAVCAVTPAEATYASTFGAFEKASDLLNLGWGRLNHLDSVCDEPAQRAALNAMLPEVSEFYASIPLNEKLWAVLKAFGESPAVAELGTVEKRFVAETMLDFVQSGADLPEDQKTRVAAVEAELSKLTKQYSEHVLDSTNAWELLIEDEAKLAGLPASAKAAALANAKSKELATDEKPAWRFTLQMPSMFPLMQHLDDDGIRRQVWEASVKVAAQGEHDNTELVWQILELRKEKAAILGHGHFADLTLQRRMARNGETALRFTENLHDRIEAPFHAEYRSLCDYKGAKTGQPVDGLQPWEFAYWSEKRRQEEYDLDDEALRPYFPVDRVMGGMFDLCSKLFGITIHEKKAAYFERGSNSQPSTPDSQLPEVWHPEVKFYDLLDTKTGEHLGSFYADWHPRESKRGGAWMNCLFTGHPGGDGSTREAHLGLIIGNMTPPVDGKQALLTHGEVETIFHEFGHLLHGLLSDVPVRSLAGTNVPWDFVELPSQIMENFCWDRRSLDYFAKHHETSATIPDDLYDRMIAAKNYMSATAFMRQLAFGKLDLELHTRLDRYEGRDLDEVDREILASYRVPLKTDSPSMARRFNHLFSSPTGYAAGYYSYKWAEVLDADAFTRFQENGVIDPETGAAFREHILSKGNSVPVDELFRRFMGRDPELGPLLERSGLAGPLLADAGLEEPACA
ncbi:M3 family metallopeptidase [Luteolibacter arcticus]|uniref:oligopeptidase A n=1 Tax=Luteolibacter arcticus TaxID=1581411 RepID=A0ABT3GJK2_9BACT|nr:M3 family metallopeptidase [Luteolibacter arcticus]MCW1923703.1 M3 family metallopeptidase [Luteolibacter arcticus]